MDKRWEIIPYRIGVLGSIPFLLNAIVSAMSLFNGMIFSIDAGSTYSRGRYFVLIIGINILYFIGGQLHSIRHLWKKRERESLQTLIFPYPAIIAAFIQAYVEGVQIMLLAFSLTLLMGFLYNQNTYANRDFLTGLYNRSIGEEYLNHLFQHRNKKSS